MRPSTTAVVAGFPKSWQITASITASAFSFGRPSISAFARSIAISVWVQTSPSGCHSFSCGQPLSAWSSGKRLPTTPRRSAHSSPIEGRRAFRRSFSNSPQILSAGRSERIWGEFEKLLLKARRPSIGLEWADRLGVVGSLFPELQALKGCPQEKEWHPEGDVWTHTLMAIDRAKAEIDGLPKEKALAVMLAVICHDFGKPATTAVVDGRIRSYEHEEAGIPPTRAFLDRLNVRTLHGYDLREQVVQLVAHHLTPSHYFKNRDNVGDGAC